MSNTQFTGTDIEALRKHEETKQHGQFWKVPNGTTAVRILPNPNPDEPTFYFETGVHYINNKSVYCPRYNKEGENNCPICAYVSKLYEAADKGDKAAEATAKKIRAKKTYLYNVYVPAQDKVAVMQTGVTIKKELIEIFMTPDYGDISHPMSGREVNIKRDGQGINTGYKVLPAGNAGPIKGELKKPKEAATLTKAVLDQRVDLETLVSYPTTLQVQADLNAFLGVADVSPAKATKAKKQEVVDEDEDYDGSDETEEAGGDDETLDDIAAAMAELEKLK